MRPNQLISTAIAAIVIAIGTHAAACTAVQNSNTRQSFCTTQNSCSYYSYSPTWITCNTTGYYTGMVCAYGELHFKVRRIYTCANGCAGILCFCQNPQGGDIDPDGPYWMQDSTAVPGTNCGGT